MNYTEEEKEAIDFFVRRQKFMGNYRYKLEENTDIILNLIEKQQKEIEELKKINNLSIGYIAKEPIIKGCPIDPIDLMEDNNRLQMQIKDSIPKEVIREKIKELNRTYVQLPVQHMKVAQIQVLKELLGE